MTIPQNVRDALSRVQIMCDDEAERSDIGLTDWPIVRAHLLSQEAELADYKNASLHAADDCVAKDAEIARLNRLLESMTNLAVKKDSQIKIAESRLAAANALLRETETAVRDLCRCYGHPLPQATLGRIEAHWQGAGDEA